MRPKWQRNGCGGGNYSRKTVGMIYILLTSGVSLVILGLLLWAAPRGWQDEDGFHLGEEPEPEITELPVSTKAALPSKVPAHRKAA